MRARHGRLIRGILYPAVFAALRVPSIGRADDAEVKAAHEAAHAAIESIGIGDIANVWSHGTEVTLVDPGDTTVPRSQRQARSPMRWGLFTSSRA